MILLPRVAAAGLVLLAATLAVVSPRLMEKRRIERANRTVEICVDLRGAAMVAAADGLSLEATLKSFREAGAVSAGIEERLVSPGALSLVGADLQVGPVRLPHGTPAGFDPALLRLVEQSGLDPVLRPWNGTGGGARGVVGAAFWPPALSARLVIPAGDEIPGYPDAAAAFGSYVATHGGRFGFVEFAEQLGARPAAAGARGQVVVVHSLGEREMAAWEEEGRRRPIRPVLLARWVRAARERAVRVLYVHPFFRLPLGSRGTLTNVNAEYVRDIASALRARGYDIGRAAPWPAFGWGARRARLQQVVALLATVAAPLLALALAAAVVTRTPAGLPAVAGPFAGAAAGAVAALAGGLVVSGCLSSDAFLLRLDTFRGVKAGLLIPILIAALYLYRDSFHPGSASWWRERLTASVRVWHVAAFLALAGAGAALLVRSGNQAGVRLGGMEEGLRLMLEDLFGARPRFNPDHHRPAAARRKGDGERHRHHDWEHEGPEKCLGLADEFPHACERELHEWMMCAASSSPIHRHEDVCRSAS